ncbi:MAG: molybdopterin-binding protein [Armatimonadetes bacterium]|nr:molybdopterin-binding protein [Armatimonadota bacterium]MDW8122728.1 molybdopterin-binding protein [Armatimonadota bacterium]
MSEVRWAEILTIGTEILLGDVLDTNSQWLSRRLVRMGASVRRHVTVGDDEREIVTEVRHALSRAPDLLITTGGLGPTDDDRTLSAVAQALNVPLILNEEALKMIAQRYKELFESGAVDSPEMTPSRTKMAYLPAGGEPLLNQVGTAPGVWLAVGKTTLVCLPGVPAELKDIFTNALPPLLKSVLGTGYYSERLYEVTCKDESVLSSILKEVASAHPDVYLKSKVRPFGTSVRIRLFLSASGVRPEDVEQSLRQTVDDLLVQLEPMGILLIPIPTDDEE